MVPPMTSTAAAMIWLLALPVGDQITVGRAIVAAENMWPGIEACAVPARGVNPPDGTVIEAGGHLWAVWRVPAEQHDGWALCSVRVIVRGEV